ncbi:MAG: hypothetical protein JWM11_4587 [Planctomycetaceae bacterium]|nr:hypothetical protein [Planctomycetaceae bacterium]
MNGIEKITDEEFQEFRQKLIFDRFRKAQQAKKIEAGRTGNCCNQWQSLSVENYQRSIRRVSRRNIVRLASLSGWVVGQ